MLTYRSAFEFTYVSVAVCGTLYTVLQLCKSFAVLFKKEQNDLSGENSSATKSTSYVGTDEFYEQLKSYMKKKLTTARIKLVENSKDWELIYCEISKDLELFKVMGLDCEWVTKGKTRCPVSMLQLSTVNNTALVRLHLLKQSGGVPVSLSQLLSDKSCFLLAGALYYSTQALQIQSGNIDRPCTVLRIHCIRQYNVDKMEQSVKIFTSISDTHWKTVLKFGVGILEDRDKLLSDYNLDVKGCIDLRHLATRCKKSWSGFGLKNLASEVADIELDKSDLLRKGDWEADILSAAMQRYAARDSQSGLIIFLCIVALKLSPNTPLDKHSDSETIIEVLRKRAGPLCQGLIEEPYKNSMQQIKKASTVVDYLKVPPIQQTVSSNALRSKIMYSNCQMLAPDGQLLCVCDAKKAQWYCDKGLADFVSGENDAELVIKLRFEPRGRPNGDHDYYRSRKENICVVCGASNSFIRKNIVPREYRKHFPEILKSHSSHDVLLLCASCHKKSSTFDQEYKEYFATLCNAPYKSGTIAQDADIKRVKSAARALNGYSNKLPEEKQKECKQIVSDYFGVDDVTDSILKTACELDEKAYNAELHGESVVKYFTERKSIQEFQKLWRKRFLEKMQPKHLGEYWQVDYDHMNYIWVKDSQQDPET